MLVLNLQFFGGRGSGSNDRGASALSTEDWRNWSDDPSIFQRLERGEDLSEEFDDQGIYDQYEDYVAKAKRIQTEASTYSLKGTATLYRGERFNSLEAAQRKYSKGAVITTNQLTSYSTDANLAKSYAQMYGNKVAVVIENTNTHGNFVGVRANHYGDNKDPEVIVQRGMESKVAGTHYDAKNKILYVKMTNSVTPKKKRGKK